MLDLFIELLQLSLGTRESLSRAPSIDEWEALYKESHRQAILGIMAGGLPRIPNSFIAPEELLVQWLGRKQKTERKYALHCKRAKELTSLFRSFGVRSCVLKGVAVASFYPVPSSRQLGDIDLWVDGNRKDITSRILNEYQVGDIRWHHTDVQIFDDVPTEIHFHATWLFNPWHNRKLQHYLEDAGWRIMSTVSESIGFAIPDASFNAIYSLVHSFHHLLESGIGLRHVVDYFYIVRALRPEDREEIIRMIDTIGLSKFLGAMMWVLQEVCGMSSSELLCAPNEREGQFLLDEVLRGGNFGHHRHDNRSRNSFARMFALLPHYPSELVWMVPWKVWHWSWRKTNGKVA